MISFRNTRGIMLFQSFIDREEAKSILGDKNDSFIAVLPSDVLANIFCNNDYLAINGKYIYYNAEKCNEAGLSNEERMACIAHELGHYYDETPKDDSCIIREMNADRFALDIVPFSSLVSALSKLRNAFPEGCERSNLEQRIKVLNNLIDCPGAES